MERKPIAIPWKELMPDRDDPLPMLDVVPAVTSDAGAAGHQALAEGASDHQLAEKVERLRGNIESGFADKLPDKGAKLRASLRALEKEQERRSLVHASNDKEEGECEEIKRLETRSSPDLLKKPSSNGPTSHHASGSFGFCFSKFLEAEASGANREAYSDVLSFMRKGDFKKLSKLKGKRISQGMPSRASPFQGPKGIADADKQQSCNNHHKGISSGSSFRFEWVNQFPRRRKSPENHSSLRPESTKVQDVVLLDEDVQSVEQIHEGEGHGSDERLPSSKENKIYYPSRDHPECVELHQSDIKCLEPESYLSSTVMNFYIQYLQKSISSSGRPSTEYHFCNTYFYSKLEGAISHKGEAGKYFAKLRRWWKGINIFEKAYIFLPIHRDLHWSLVIICIPAKEDELGPIILHLDSLEFHASNMIFDNIERYLEEEWTYLNETTHYLDIPFSERIWRDLPQSIERKRITVPQQKNEYDCGLFVLYFIERFIEAAPARLKRVDLAMFGGKWFHPKEASGLRKRLKRLILEEFSRVENHRTES